jgi:hypothetical protein
LVACEDEVDLAQVAGRCTVMNHLSIFREMFSDFASMEVNYENEDLTLLLLVSLPSSFRNLCDTI